MELYDPHGDLEISSRSPKSNHLLKSSKNISVLILKIRSRSPKTNHLLKLSK